MYKYHTVQATPGLVLPVERTTGLHCIPEGRTVNYECTVNDADKTSTVWLVGKSACATLLHSSFEGNVINCTRFMTQISAMALHSVGTNYTSRLTLIADIALNGTSIDCTVGGGATDKSDVIVVGGKP